jgi:hypothetical protein
MRFNSRAVNGASTFLFTAPPPSPSIRVLFVLFACPP